MQVQSPVFAICWTRTTYQTSLFPGLSGPLRLAQAVLWKRVVTPNPLLEGTSTGWALSSNVRRSCRHTSSMVDLWV